MEQSWDEKVRERAHAIWERDGRPEGGADRHWAQAEEELRAEEQNVLKKNVRQAVSDQERVDPVEENEPTKRARRVATKKK